MKITIQNIEWCSSAIRIIYKENININLKYLYFSLFNLNKTKLERLKLFFYDFLKTKLKISNLDFEYFNKKLYIDQNQLIFSDDCLINQFSESTEYYNYILKIKELIK